jgi:integrase
LRGGTLRRAIPAGVQNHNVFLAPDKRTAWVTNNNDGTVTVIAGDSFARLLRQVGEPHRTMVSLIAATGLRIGELLALRWSSLDLENGTLTVHESVYEGKFQPPKTRRALRTIPLGRHAVAALNAHRERTTRRESEDLVFGNRRGDPMHE